MDGCDKHDHDCDELCEELCDEIATEVSAQFSQRTVAAQGPNVGRPVTSLNTDIVLGVVKGLLDVAAKTYGDAFANLILSQKDQIKKLVGDAALDAVDKVIHGLRAA